MASHQRSPWSALLGELDVWASLGHRARLWFRDDDASSDIPGLRWMVQNAAACDVPIFFAVIPGLLTEDAESLLRSHPNHWVLQHGYDHADHSLPGQEQTELCDHRDIDEVARQLEQGRQRLEEAFAERFLPVMVPPWHRIGPRIGSCLSAWHFEAFSAHARGLDRSVDFLPTVDAQIDLMRWSDPFVFIGRDDLEHQLVEELELRRLRDAFSKPVGILSHHSMMCSDKMSAIRELWSLASAHAGARWLGGTEVFSVGPSQRPDSCGRSEG